MPVITIHCGFMDCALCSRSPGAAAAARSPPQLPRLCSAQHKFSVGPSACQPSRVPQIQPPFQGAHGRVSFQLRESKGIVFFPKYRWVNIKYRMRNTLCYGSFGTAQAAFYYANAHLKETPVFHVNDIIKLIIVY